MIQQFDGKKPQMAGPCVIHERATVIGDVRMGERVNVWPGAVVRADENHITIGDRTNVQDNCVLHVSHERPLEIGKGVTIGHAATLHACTVCDGALIGMGSVVLDGARIGAGAIVAAGALVPPGMEIPDGMLAVGMPAKVARPVKEGEIEKSSVAPDVYWTLAQQLRDENF